MSKLGYFSQNIWTWSILFWHNFIAGAPFVQSASYIEKWIAILAGKIDPAMNFDQYIPIHLYQSGPKQRLLNRWTSHLDLGCMTGWLERVVSVHIST